MLIAILNCCTKEELEEEEEETPMAVTPDTPEAVASGSIECDPRDTLIGARSVDEGSSERRQIIKNKILAVGRMSRVFALLR